MSSFRFGSSQSGLELGSHSDSQSGSKPSSHSDSQSGSQPDSQPARSAAGFTRSKRSPRLGRRDHRADSCALRARR